MGKGRGKGKRVSHVNHHPITAYLHMQLKNVYHSVLFVRINIAVHIHDGNQSPAERVDKLGDMLILSVFRS